MMVTIHRIAEGTCDWSGKTCECVYFEFKDGEKGCMAWNAFKKYLKLKLSKAQK